MTNYSYFQVYNISVQLYGYKEEVMQGETKSASDIAVIFKL